MAEDKKQSEGSSFFNANTALALLTLFGGVWFVSQRLTSNRPVITAGNISQSHLGAQTVEARLWEDPFKDRDRKTGESRGTADLSSLAAQIDEKSTGSNSVLLLAVMVPGGNFWRRS